MTFAILPNKTTWAEQIAYCYAAREKARREYNAKGAEHAAKRLSDRDWQEYQRASKQERLLVSIAINELRAAIPKSALDAIDLGKTFTADGTWETKVAACVACHVAVQQSGKDPVGDPRLAESGAVFSELRLSPPQNALDEVL